MDKNTVMLTRLKEGETVFRDKLCEENMGLVRKVASKFSSYSMDIEDLMQVGSIGLLKAIDNFDLSLGVKFSTYAVPMIIGEIRRFLRDDGIIKVSRSIKQNAYRVYRIREELSVSLCREPTIQEIADKSGLKKEEVVEAMSATQQPDSINREAYDDSDEEFSDRLASDTSEDKIVNRICIRSILERLDSRERQILVLRYFKGKTQAEIAPIIGVSQVQVSRIEKKVIERLRREEFM